MNSPTGEEITKYLNECLSMSISLAESDAKQQKQETNLQKREAIIKEAKSKLQEVIKLLDTV